MNETISSDVTKNFWDYAKNLYKVSSLENAFLNWVSDNRIDFKYAKEAWNLINEEVKTAFDDIKNPGSPRATGTGVKGVKPVSISEQGATGAGGAGSTDTSTEKIEMPTNIPSGPSKPMVGSGIGDKKPVKRIGILNFLED